jgi:hypothetical protein
MPIETVEAGWLRLSPVGEKIIGPVGRRLVEWAADSADYGLRRRRFAAWPGYRRYLQRHEIMDTVLSTTASKSNLSLLNYRAGEGIVLVKGT